MKALVLIEMIFFTICLHRACVVKAPPCKGCHGNQGQEVNQCQLKKWSPRRRRTETLQSPLKTSGRDINIWRPIRGGACCKGACLGKWCICGDANLKIELICINSAVCEKRICQMATCYFGSACSVAEWRHFSLTRAEWGMGTWFN